MSPDAYRVLEAIRRAGTRGICRTDFEPPDVIDGRKPILNFPGRIKELKYELGEDIVRWNRQRRNKCKVWVLGNLAASTAGASRKPEPAEYGCPNGHQWTAPAVYGRSGYPLLDGAEPCPLCAMAPHRVEAAKQPARPHVIAKAAA